MSEKDLKNLECDEAELENVNGGKGMYLSPGIKSDCFCIAGGGGAEDEYQHACACVVGGGGTWKEKGQQVGGRHGISEKTAMACFGIGVSD